MDSDHWPVPVTSVNGQSGRRVRTPHPSRSTTVQVGADPRPSRLTSALVGVTGDRGTQDRWTETLLYQDLFGPTRILP